jgi:hypothetical protein
MGHLQFLLFYSCAGWFSAMRRVAAKAVQHPARSYDFVICVLSAIGSWQLLNKVALTSFAEQLLT